MIFDNNLKANIHNIRATEQVKSSYDSHDPIQFCYILQLTPAPFIRWATRIYNQPI